MAIDFRLKQHSVKPGVRLVEILQDGKVVGAMYPTDAGIKLVSAHFADPVVDKDFAGEVVPDNGSTTWPLIPCFWVSFKPSPYLIVGNKIFKLPKE